MAKYRKKPVVIEAVQWTGKNEEEIKEFVGSQAEFYYYPILENHYTVTSEKPESGDYVIGLTIKTLEGAMI